MSRFTCPTCKSNTCADFDTWHNPAWVNREQYWSHRSECWLWRTLKATSPARVSKPLAATEGSLSIADLKEEIAFAKGMQNWTDEEVEELLGR